MLLTKGRSRIHLWGANAANRIILTRFLEEEGWRVVAEWPTHVGIYRDGKLQGNLSTLLGKRALKKAVKRLNESLEEVLTPELFSDSLTLTRLEVPFIRETIQALRELKASSLPQFTRAYGIARYEQGNWGRSYIKLEWIGNRLSILNLGRLADYEVDEVIAIFEAAQVAEEEEERLAWAIAMAVALRNAS